MHWNKNAEYVNSNTPKQMFYKLPHYKSYTAPMIKFGTIMGEFIRMRRNSSSTAYFITAGKQKIEELKLLEYPVEYIASVLDALKRSKPDQPDYGTLRDIIIK